MVVLESIFIGIYLFTLIFILTTIWMFYKYPYSSIKMILRLYDTNPIMFSVTLNIILGIDLAYLTTVILSTGLAVTWFILYALSMTFIYAVLEYEHGKKNIGWLKYINQPLYKALTGDE